MILKDSLLHHSGISLSFITAILVVAMSNNGMSVELSE
jgi:hypothetical protein